MEYNIIYRSKVNHGLQAKKYIFHNILENHSVHYSFYKSILDDFMTIIVTSYLDKCKDNHTKYFFVHFGGKLTCIFKDI